MFQLLVAVEGWRVDELNSAEEADAEAPVADNKAALEAD